MNRNVCLLVLVWISGVLCLGNDAFAQVKTGSAPVVARPILSTKTIMQDFNHFWDYYGTHIELYHDFLATDQSGKLITKNTFLNQLKSGRYFPLACYANNDQPHYQLTKIPVKADANISAYMKMYAEQELIYQQLKGKPAPIFNFKDINGKLYTSANTKGKIVLFKCWFINCTACVKEMPALNALVKKYSNRKDVLFISLAIDQKKELQQFFGKTRFDYATVPDQNDYMTQKLKTRSYPTHYLINKKGVLIAVLPDDVRIAAALQKELAK